MRTLERQRRERGNEGPADVDIEALAKAFEHDADDLVISGWQVPARTLFLRCHDRPLCCCDGSPGVSRPLLSPSTLAIGRHMLRQFTLGSASARLPGMVASMAC